MSNGHVMPIPPFGDSLGRITINGKEFAKGPGFKGKFFLEAGTIAWKLDFFERIKNSLRDNQTRFNRRKQRGLRNLKAAEKLSASQIFNMKHGAAATKEVADEISEFAKMTYRGVRRAMILSAAIGLARAKEVASQTTSKTGQKQERVLGRNLLELSSNIKIYGPIDKGNSVMITMGPKTGSRAEATKKFWSQNFGIES